MYLLRYICSLCFNEEPTLQSQSKNNLWSWLKFPMLEQLRHIRGIWSSGAVLESFEIDLILTGSIVSSNQTKYNHIIYVNDGNNTLIQKFLDIRHSNTKRNKDKVWGKKKSDTSQNWPLVKNPQFLSNPLETKAKLLPHELIILTKFH